MAEDEWSAMMKEPDTEAHKLSSAARAALWSATPYGGIGRVFSCSIYHLAVTAWGDLARNSKVA